MFFFDYVHSLFLVIHLMSSACIFRVKGSQDKGKTGVCVQTLPVYICYIYISSHQAFSSFLNQFLCFVAGAKGEPGLAVAEKGQPGSRGQDGEPGLPGANGTQTPSDSQNPAKFVFCLLCFHVAHFVTR